MKRPRSKTILWHIVSPLIWPFVLFYALIVRLRNAAYDLQIFKPRHLRRPVISVGNLSVGGTGKTSFVILLASLLEARGWNTDVLSRGYGRDSRRICSVDPDGDAKIFGDEPLLMARRGLSVYVAADRYHAGLLAETEPAMEIDATPARAVHILDDGFQHRKLNRAVNIVLLRRDDLTDDMLPAGRLREPLCALERADICVLRTEDADLKDRVLRLMQKTDPAQVWIVDRRITLPASAHIHAGGVLAFCAIGDPHDFFDGLQRAGIKINKEVAFRDHHSYTLQDIERLKTVARNVDAKCFLTTEKDSIRLEGNLRTELEKQCPLVIAGLEVALRDQSPALTTLESMLLIEHPDVR
jgi:tetraacyldisaccharide 4'-kinase